MFARLRRWLMLKSMTACGPVLKIGTMPYDVRFSPSESQSCFTCAYFDYCDPNDVDGSDGYCCHPGHSDPTRSEHADYGGQWTSRLAWCEWWAAADPVELAERTVTLAAVIAAEGKR